MSVPSLNKINTLGITYTQGRIRDYHYQTIFEKIMSIPEEEIDGIDDRDETRFIFQVTTHERYKDICLKFTTRDILLEPGHVIRVDDISSEGTRVEISRVPFDVSNEMLTKILKSYGDVLKCQTYFHNYGKYNKCKKSGIRIAWMNIKSHIPPTINIKQMNNFLNVTYENQPFACNKCGMTGHGARSCRRKPNEYMNTIENICFNIDETDIDNSVIEDIDMDIHLDPSQNNNKFNCPKCEYTCTYENILIDHMECHTNEEPPAYAEFGEKPSVPTSLVSKKDRKQIKCHICEFDCNNTKSLEEHMSQHENEILLKCTECDFNCRNEDVLNIHSASHNIHACKICNFHCKTERQLSDHVKTHSGKTYICPECDYTSKNASKFNNHMQYHIGEIDSGEATSLVQENDSRSSKNSKRGLSVSPEAIDNNNKTLRSNKGQKKSKT